ncbi:hypothetical protein SSX86_007850 [Deinandra increscens subsp. villosa]|uniref:Transposase-associated domain-containing protein n=1 Tax=Deinandra increscens subsp. villosa TaxID=3103831 RepID=A0AAP0DE78_9ASTR
MDRSHWMYNIGRIHQSYLLGVQNFLKIAEDDRVIKGKESILCPCMECKNFKEFEDKKDIEYHLLRNGFMYNYTCWSRHGESFASCSTTSTSMATNDNENNDPYISNDNDNFNRGNDDLNGKFSNCESSFGDNDQEKLQHMFADSEKPLYAGFENFSKLSVVLKLFNLKSNYGWSDKSFTSLLEILHDMLPKDNELPISLARYNHITKKFELGAHLLSEGVLKGRLDELQKKEIEMKKNGSYYEHGKDVVTEVIGKGSQHGGRTRLVSHVVGVRKSLLSGKNKQKSKEAEVLTEEIDATQQDHDRIAAATERGLGRHASSGAPVRLYNDLPDIKSLSGCYLLLKDDDSVVARGRVYPTSERIIHGRPIADGFVKVHVDFVFDNYRSSDIPPGTQTDEFKKMGDAKGQFIQWPRKLIKIMNTDSFGQSSIDQSQNVSVPTSQSTHCVNDEQPQPQHTLSPAYRPHVFVTLYF